MNYGTRLKFAMARWQPRHAAPILCASIGRVGSYMLFEEILRARIRAILGYCSFEILSWRSREIWTLAGAAFEPCTVAKTHDLPYQLAAPKNLKVVFLYGRPSDSIISLMGCQQRHGEAWMKEHFDHMHASGSYEDILRRDVLGLEEQIDAWARVPHVAILGMRYETLWQNIGVLNQFLGYDVRLPDRTSRSSDVSADAQLLARSAYGKLDRKVAELPDYYFSPP